MSKKRSDRDYSPGKRDSQEWQVFNRLKRWIDENGDDIDILINIIINGTDPVVFGEGTPNYVTKWITAHILGDSITYDTGYRWGVGTEGPSDILTLEGTSEHTFWLERNPTIDSDGSNFTIQAGGTTDDMVKTSSLVAGGTGYVVGDLVYLTAHLGGYGAYVTVDSITSPYGLNTVSIASVGSGYLDGEWDFNVPGGSGGVVRVTVLAGIVTDLDITSIGTGYSTAAGVAITLEHDDGVGATLDIDTINGAIATYSLTYKGSKYSTGVKASTSSSYFGENATINVTEVYNTLDGDGGNLILKPGTSTGTGIGEIQFFTADPSSSSRIDNILEQRAVINSLGYWGLNVIAPLSWSDIDGSIGNSIETIITASTNLDVTQFDVLADASASSFTAWLPNAVTHNRRRHRVKCIGLGTGKTFFVKSLGGNIESYAAATGIEFTEVGQVMEFHSDGVQWWIMNSSQVGTYLAFRYITRITNPLDYPIVPTWGDTTLEADSYKDILYFEGSDGISILIDAANDAVKFTYTGTLFAFKTITIDPYPIAWPDGNPWDATSVVADQADDTLYFEAGDGISITMDSVNDAIRFSFDDDHVNPFAFFRIEIDPPITSVWADMFVEADKVRDTLSLIAGDGMNIIADANIDAIKFESTLEQSFAFETIFIDTDVGYTWNDDTVIADSPNDLLTLVGGTNVTIEADAELDAIKISIDTEVTPTWAFKYINAAADSGYTWDDTGVVADQTEDTLTFVAGSDIAIVMDAESDAIRISYTGSSTGDPDQNLFETVAIDNSDSEYTWNDSSVVAEITTDTLTLVAGTDITLYADDALDAIKIAFTGTAGEPDQLLFEKVAIDNTDTEYTWGVATEVEADATDDTLTLVAGTYIELAVDAALDAIRIKYTGPLGTVQNLFETISIVGDLGFTWDDQTMIADDPNDTLKLVAGDNIVLVMDAELDALRISTVANVANFAFKKITLDPDGDYIDYLDYNPWADRSFEADRAADTLYITEGDGIKIYMDELNDGIKFEVDTEYIEDTIISHNYFFDYWSILSCNFVAGGIADRTSTFGRLYNAFAVADSRGIAPSGWRVPTKADFLALLEYVEPGADADSNTAGGHLKSDDEAHWKALNVGADNSMGFSAKGSGSRSSYSNEYKGRFSVVKYWTNDLAWTSSGHDFYYAAVLQNATEIFSVSAGAVIAEEGHNIRFIKITTSLTHGQTDTVTDQEGNVYDTICIGAQEWMSQDFIGTKFNNNDDITSYDEYDDWGALTTAGVCDYNDQETNSFETTPSAGAEYKVDPHDKVKFCAGTNMVIGIIEVDDLITLTFDATGGGGGAQDQNFIFRDVITGVADTYNMYVDTAFAFTLTGFVAEVDSGTLTDVTLEIDGVAADILVDGITITTTKSEIILSESVTANQRITLVLGTGYTGTPGIIRGSLRILPT